MNHQQAIEQIKELINQEEQNPEYIIMSIRAIVMNNHCLALKPLRYTLDEIAQQITDFTGLTMDEINEDSRRLAIIQFRQMAHYKAVLFSSDRLEEIGRYFGNRDHSTVLNSKRKIQNLLETDKRFREQYETFLNN